MYWYGEESRAQEVLVRYKAPGAWRQEILSPTGEVEQVIFQRDNQEWIYDPREKTVVYRSTSVLRGGDLDAKALLDLLYENYTLKDRGREEVLNSYVSRVVELAPRHSGGVRRILWVDPRTGIVLKTKQLTMRGSLVSETHFMELTPDAHLPEELFLPPDASSADVMAEVSRESLRGPAELEVEGFHDLPWLNRLPHGFVMDHVTLIPLDGDNALHFRYVDGLSTLSFFVSPRPVKDDANSVPLAGVGHDDPTFSFSSPVGNILKWEQSGFYCLLVGDLEPENLQAIRNTLFNRQK